MPDSAQFTPGEQKSLAALLRISTFFTSILAQHTLHGSSALSSLSYINYLLSLALLGIFSPSEENLKNCMDGMCVKYGYYRIMADIISDLKSSLTTHILYLPFFLHQ